jgi:hypothetical protein
MKLLSIEEWDFLDAMQNETSAVALISRISDGEKVIKSTLDKIERTGNKIKSPSISKHTQISHECGEVLTHLNVWDINNAS